MSSYSEAWFRAKRSGVEDSSRVLVPRIMDLIAPESVVDVGCGTGGWLATFSDHGVARICGVDGDWVPRDQLVIPPDCFIAADLRDPIELDQKFDLALSLEVGEHLPHQSSERFVLYLTQLAPVVVFSAAIPGQPGHDHINTQWPEYWIERFDALAYVPVDAIRPWAWAKDSVKYFYRQNMLVFVDTARITEYPKLAAIAASSEGPVRAIVHSRLYEVYLERDFRRRIKSAIHRLTSLRGRPSK
ncbi:MAG: class I SAM-dependent methyltransferase [Acidimicrobiia bacterium]